MTHDECGTTDLVHVPVWDIMFSPLQFQSANNHILHSLFMKWSVSLFGWHEWSIRLPNLLAFGVYYGAALRITKRITSQSYLQLAGVFILCSAPFVLDFFSLARGYGIATAFGLFSFAALNDYFYNENKKHLFVAFATAACAVYANFTWLNLYAGLWAVFVAGWILMIKKEQPFLKAFVSINLYPLLFAGVLAVLSYLPISFLKTKDEFKWGANNWIDSFKTFCNDWIYNYQIGNWNASGLSNTLMYLFSIGIILAWMTGMIRSFKTKATSANSSVKTMVLASSLILILVGGTIVQRHLLNTFYIDGRKALFYFPLVLLLLSILTIKLLEQNRFYLKATGTALLLLFAFQFTRNLNLYSCREWWYDASSKDAALFISKHKANPEKNVAVHWLFRPSFNFYNEHGLQHRLWKVVTLEETDQLGNIQYYYVHGEDIHSIHPIFKPVKRYFWDRFILVRDAEFYKYNLELAKSRLKTTDPTLSPDELIQTAEQVLWKERKELNWNTLLWSE